MIATGWWEALAYVWVIALLNLTYAAATALGVHPVAFLLEAFLLGGIALVVIAKPGENAVRIVLAPQTWGYGVATIASEILYFMMIAYVPPADASIFMRLNILLTILLTWLLLGRAITGLRLLGMAIVLIGLVVTAAFYPMARSAPFLGATLAASAFMSIRNLSAEFHPWNRSARTVVDKMRVTGLVVLATSCVGLVATALIAWLVAQGVLPATPLLPPLAQFVALPTLLLSLMMGCILITVMQYLMFSSVVKITSENFFAVMALSPLATLVLQEAAARAGVIGALPAGWSILPFMVLILIGNLLIVWPGRPAIGDEVARP
jgi:uncharacterized membrane protein